MFVRDFVQEVAQGFKIILRRTSCVGFIGKKSPIKDIIDIYEKIFNFFFF